MMNTADPMEFSYPSGVDADSQLYQLYFPTTLADSSGVQVSQFSASQFGYQMDTDGSLEGLFPPHDSIGPAQALASSHSPHGSHYQSDASHEGYAGPKNIKNIVMANIHSSTPSAFLPTALTHEIAGSSASPSSNLEYGHVPEVDTYDDSPPPVTVATPRSILLHPSLRRIQPPARTSPQSESSGEPEIYELDGESESEPEVVEVAPPSKKRKRTADASIASEHQAKRARLPRGTKTSANKKLKISPSPPKPPRPQLPTPPPKRKPRTPSPPKEKPHPSSKPGYPYWGTEHSAKPPPLVSTPIERREVGLHTLVDPPNGERPAYNYITLIRHAILGCPDKRLTIDAIYEQIMGRFEYYRDQNGKCDKGWKNSVRHQMSLSACFEKKERLVWESGKGVWWVVNESVEGGTKRERKRNRPTKAEKLANPELYPPKPKAIALPITASSLSQPPVQDTTVEYPLFPNAFPSSLTAASANVPGSEGSTPQPQLPQQQQHLDSPSSLAWVQPMVPASYVSNIAPPRTSLPTSLTSGMGLTHSSLQGLLKPVAGTTTISSLNPPFRSALPSASMIPSSRSITSNRTSFGSSRDKQGAGSTRGVVHTRWQSSVDLPFDATPRETGVKDTSDSEEDDD